MNILVTGGCGFIGTNFIHSIISKDFNILNIGNSKSVKLSKLLEIIKMNTNKQIKFKIKPRNNSDVVKTKADSKNLFYEIKYKPSTSIEKGYQEFINWFKRS